MISQAQVAPDASRADRRQQLLDCLADGARHSGAVLARDLGISRTAVWQHIKALRAAGAEVFSKRGGGYRLDEPLDLLDAGTIRKELSAEARARLQALDVYFETDSTNERLLQRAATDDVHAHACLAEIQTAGRGRRGRTWIAPLGGALAMSLAWRFQSGIEALRGLSLAVGVGVHRALEACGVGRGLTLKWPNDILWQGRKLGGVLVEVRGESCGPALAVIGVGINVALTATARRSIGQPVADLRAVLGRRPPRNMLAAAVLREVLAVVRMFERHGFAAFAQHWRRRDGIRGRRVGVVLPSGRVSGRAEGVDADGALLLSVHGSLRRYPAGELSVRLTR